MDKELLEAGYRAYTDLSAFGELRARQREAF